MFTAKMLIANKLTVAARRETESREIMMIYVLSVLFCDFFGIRNISVKFCTHCKMELQDEKNFI